MKFIACTMLIIFLFTACTPNITPAQTREINPRTNIAPTLTLTSMQIKASATPSVAPTPIKGARIISHAKIAFSGCGNCADNPVNNSTRGIYVLDLDNYQVKFLSNLIPYYGNKYGAFNWSPDAKRFAFLANSDSIINSSKKGSGLWVANVETNEVNLVFPITAEEQISDYKWSPDGSRLAFHFDDSSYSNEIILINKDGSGRKSIRIDPSIPKGDPSFFWFPDGGRLFVMTSPGDIISIESGKQVLIQYGAEKDHLKPVIVSPKLDKIILTDGGFDRASNLYLCNLDGSGLRKLSSSPNYYYHPEWSKDGSRISVSYQKDLMTSPQVGVMNSDGDNFLQATNNPDYDLVYASFSPDGQRIMVSAKGGRVDKKNYAFWQVLMISAAGELKLPDIILDKRGGGTSFFGLPDVPGVLIIDYGDSSHPTKSPIQFLNFQTGKFIDLFADLEIGYQGDLSISPQ